MFFFFVAPTKSEKKLFRLGAVIFYVMLSISPCASKTSCDQQFPYLTLYSLTLTLNEDKTASSFLDSFPGVQRCRSICQSGTLLGTIFTPPTCLPFPMLKDVMTLASRYPSTCDTRIYTPAILIIICNALLAPFVISIRKS